MSRVHRGKWCKRTTVFYSLTYEDFIRLPLALGFKSDKKMYVGPMLQAMRAGRQLNPRVLRSLLLLGYHKNVKTYFVKRSLDLAMRQYHRLEKSINEI